MEVLSVNRKKLGIGLIAAGFFVNFIAIIVLLIPFVTRQENKTLTYVGGALYIFVALLIIVGSVIIIKDKK